MENAESKGVWGHFNKHFCNAKVFLYEKTLLATAVRRSGGEIVMRPFDVRHANSDLKKTGLYAQGVGVNTRIVMEHTSIYWKPIALTLKKAGFFCVCSKCYVDPRFQR